MSDEVKRDGFTYRIVRCGGSEALAVRRPDGSVCLVRDLSDLEGSHQPQIGISWEQAENEIGRMEEERARSFSRFRDEQERVRVWDWRRRFETEVLRPMLIVHRYTVTRCAEEILSNPLLQSSLKMYGLTEDPGKHFRDHGAGRRPSQDRVLKRAEELAGELENLGGRLAWSQALTG